MVRSGLRGGRLVGTLNGDSRQLVADPPRGADRIDAPLEHVLNAAGSPMCSKTCELNTISKDSSGNAASCNVPWCTSTPSTRREYSAPNVETSTPFTFQPRSEASFRKKAALHPTSMMRLSLRKGSN